VRADEFLGSRAGSVIRVLADALTSVLVVGCPATTAMGLPSRDGATSGRDQSLGGDLPGVRDQSLPDRLVGRIPPSSPRAQRTCAPTPPPLASRARTTPPTTGSSLTATHGIRQGSQFLPASTTSPAPSHNVRPDRGRLINCTEVGVQVLRASGQAIHRRRPRLIVGAAAVVLFGCCLLGPAVPVAVVAGTSIWAAVIDHRTLRIPNRLVLACIVVVAIGAAALWLIGPRTSTQIALALFVGVLLGGGPILFLFWLVRPAAVGGGDWKLLLAQGAALGLVAPLAAGLVLLVAAPVVAVQRLTHRELPPVALGPGLAAGFVTSASAAFVFPHLLGGIR
jgi:Flp pilus assembly protein protease CpaA